MSHPIKPNGLGHTVLTDQTQHLSHSALSCISVVLIVHNAAHQLGLCLQSLTWCNDIVVVDSGSTDATIDIAKNMGARVLHQPWLGFGKQKQWAVNQARHDWVLCLDADEVLSAELQNALQSLHLPTHIADLNMAYPIAYALARCNVFMGKALRHGEGYPDWCVRLFHRHFAQWSDHPVHETVMLKEHGKAQKLTGDLMHYSAENLAEYIDKQNRYTSIQAQELVTNSAKKIPIHKICLSPLVRFIRFYFFRMGFLDGLAGFVHIGIGCFFTMLKYAKARNAFKSLE